MEKVTVKPVEINEGFNQITRHGIVFNIQPNSQGNGAFTAPFVDTLIKMNEDQGIPAIKKAVKYSKEEEKQREQQGLPQEYYLYIGQSNSAPGRSF